MTHHKLISVLVANRPIDGALQDLEVRGVSSLTSLDGYNRRLGESPFPLRRISALGPELLKALRPVLQMTANERIHRGEIG